MKLKTLAALASFGGAMMIESTSSAAYLHLQTVNVNSYFQNHPNSAVKANFLAHAAGYEVWRVYAVFDGLGGANDRVNVINGQPGHPSSLQISSGGMIRNYADAVGNQFDLPPLTVASVVESDTAYRSWETWMTINRAGGDGTNGAQFTMGSQIPGQWNHFLGPWSDVTDAGLYITPDDAQGAASSWVSNGPGAPTSGVLLFQITVTAGTQFSGYFNLNIGGNGLANSDVYQQYFANFIPTPGGLTLILMARPMWSSRRRR